MSDVVDFPPVNISALLSQGERMSRRRFQDPTPEKHGKYWVIVVRKDVFRNGKLVRARERVRLALASETGERKAKRIASEYMQPINRGMETPVAAVLYNHYIEKIYLPMTKPLMASTSYGRTKGVLDNYLLPAFGTKCLRDLTPLTLQGYFSNLNPELAYESRDKIRDVMSSTLRFAVKNNLLAANPAEDVRVPLDRRGRNRNKPYLTPAQFHQVVALVPEPYATMVYVAIYTGLRVSELVGLRWNDVHDGALTIDERYCR